MAEIKHVGRVIATNKKCVVAYRTLPGDAHYCLIVPTENLPDSYHDALINLVESGAGQDAYEFAEALSRSNFPDGQQMLRALHSAGKLIKAPTAAIEMTPTTGYAIQLSELNQVIAESRGLAIDELALRPAVGEAAIIAPELAIERNKDVENAVAKTTSQSVNEVEVIDPNASPEDTAKMYRSKADKLAKEAANFRRLAEDLAPTKKKIQ